MSDVLIKHFILSGFFIGERMQIFLSFLDCLGLIRLNLSMRQQDFNHELFNDDEVLRLILSESKELMA
jgi:hypothetical protein